MTKYPWLLRFPRLYAWLSLRRRAVNYEKALYLLSIGKGDVVFDIGANLGYYTFLFSKLVGAEGRVHCFEPVPTTYEKLLENIRSCENIRTNNIASGEKRGEAEIRYNSRDLEKASLLASSHKTDSSATVEVIPLDTYVDEADLHRLDFVKCDVEGYELYALRGMERTLRHFHPELSLEVTLPLDEEKALLSFLQDIGYDTFRKVEKSFPTYELNRENRPRDYFYLHAFSSKIATPPS